MQIISVEVLLFGKNGYKVKINDPVFPKSEQFQKFKKTIEYRRYLLDQIQKNYKYFKFLIWYKWSPNGGENTDTLRIVFWRKRFFIDMDITEMTLRDIVIALDKLKYLIFSHFDEMLKPEYKEFRINWKKWGLIYGKQ